MISGFTGHPWPVGLNVGVRTIPARARKTLDRAVDLLADRLQPQFHLLLPRYERHLGERILTEDDAVRLADWMASREALARHGHTLFPGFIAALRKGCMDAFDHLPPAEPATSFRNLAQPLSLVDEDIVDEDGALAGLAARHEARASHSLMLLSQRFAVLLERPPLSASDLPIGPHAFGRALQHAARDTGLQLHGRVALYGVYEEDSAKWFEATMQAVDSLLDSMGILPGLSFVPTRPKVVPAHPERGRGHAPGPGLVAEIVAMRTVNDTLDQLVPPGSLPEHRMGERREAVAAMVRLVSRHGPDSDEWRQCREVMAEVAGAVREGRPARPGTAEWIRASLTSLGYSEVECRRLSEALVHLGQDIAGASRAPVASQGDKRSHAPSPRKEPDASANAGRR